MIIEFDLEASDINIPELAGMVFKARQNSELKNDERTVEGVEKALQGSLKHYQHVIARSDETGELIGWLGVSFVFMKDRAIIAGDWMPVILPVLGYEEKEIASALIQAAKKLVEKYNKDTLNVFFPRHGAGLAPFFRKTREWYLSQGINLLAEHVYMECDLASPGRDTTDPELPEGYEVISLVTTDADDLYRCYYETMMAGKDRIFLAENKEGSRHFFAAVHGRDKVGLNEEASLALVKDGKIVGYCQIRPEGGMERQEELTFGIHPDHRRKGLGRSLLEMSLNRAAKQGKNMCLEVDASNDVAIHLYTRSGFKEVARLGSCVWKTKEIEK